MLIAKAIDKNVNVGLLQVWMRAIVSDGPDGRVYATARALFVAPKPQRLIHDGIRLVVPAWPFGK
jgi:hypothetical protein